MCINQDDLAELAQQVSIMGDIYSSCAGVLVWIGRLYSLNAELAFQCSALDRVVSSPRPLQREDCGVYYDACKTHVDGILNNLLFCSPGKRYLLEMCHEIIKSSWFSRAWIFQEVVLPQRSAFILQGSVNASYREKLR